MSTLIERRKAAHALTRLCQELQLGTMAEVFEGDYAPEWDVQDKTLVYAYKHGRRMAIILLGQERTEIHVEHWRALIRSEHLKSVNPRVHGIKPKPAVDWKGDKISPDIIAKFPLGDVPGINLPEQPIIRDVFKRKFKLVGSL